MPVVDDISLWDMALSAGDDYELCFTVPADRRGDAESLGACCIGVIEPESAGERVRFLSPDNQPYRPRTHGYEHFRS